MEELKDLVLGLSISINDDLKDPNLVERFNNFAKEFNKTLNSLEDKEITENLKNEANREIKIRALVFKVRVLRKLLAYENGENKLEKLDLERYEKIQEGL